MLLCYNWAFKLTFDQVYSRQGWPPKAVHLWQLGHGKLHAYLWALNHGRGQEQRYRSSCHAVYVPSMCLEPRLLKSATNERATGFLHVGLDEQHVVLPIRNSPSPHPAARICSGGRLAMAHHVLGGGNHACRNPKHWVEALHCVLHPQLGHDRRRVVLVPRDVGQDAGVDRFLVCQPDQPAPGGQAEQEQAYR
jgi:hypothetical protein